MVSLTQLLFAQLTHDTTLTIYAYVLLCLGEDEDADTSEAMRTFKKTKQKKTVVSLL